MIKILLADHQPLTAAGLHHILNTKDDVIIVDYVLSRERLAELLEQHKPELLIVDYNTSGYVTKADLLTVKENFPETNVLVISADNDKPGILQVLQSGVIGYLTKECSREEILMAVYSVARGEKFFCHKILNIIMEKHFSPEPAEVVPGILTLRETEILTYLASGYSTQKVADELHLSPHTVHTHRKSIIKKLNIKSPTEFVIYALDFGLIKAK
jgi:two-component system, NarL family, invasion response regulator UvrY